MILFLSVMLLLLLNEEFLFIKQNQSYFKFSSKSNLFYYFACLLIKKGKKAPVPKNVHIKEYADIRV